VKKLALFVVAIALVGGVFYVSNTLTAKDEVRGGGPPQMPALVGVAQVQRRPMTAIRSYPGTVVANESVAITPRVTGLILSIDVELGDEVHPGDPLITIDDAEFVKRLHQAEANLELSRAMARRAETAAELAKREFDRLQTASNRGLTTEQALDSARAEHESAIANLEVAKAEVARAAAQAEEAELNVRNTKIVAPLAGRIQARNADPGELASPSSPILTIVDADPAEVVLYLPERDLQLARVGREAAVRVRGGGPDEFTGKIARVSPGLRETSRTAEVVISVPNEDLRLWPGMSADIDLVAEEEPSALAVPSEAVVYLEEAQQVYVVQDHIARATPVTVGIEQSGYTQIMQGLQEGDTVVVKGQFLIRDGEEVTYSGDEQAAATDPKLRNTD
jgi:RND family efflux transporter MFP subunit